MCLYFQMSVLRSLCNHQSLWKVDTNYATLSFIFIWRSFSTGANSCKALEIKHMYFEALFWLPVLRDTYVFTEHVSISVCSEFFSKEPKEVGKVVMSGFVFGEPRQPRSGNTEITEITGVQAILYMWAAEPGYFAPNCWKWQATAMKDTQS